ncbi:MAG TPA: class I SAM-dependent methyltransferase [Thermoplasmata archaeon]|jgi:ubiquinone/menaquinone biosynthesis C-methylase UbiE|nr:class I SAM-dependent methyltransferase [Thermoplasmata archaeon]HYB78700.1 class I SAM-dependent methyltransferase [Thermoplasmata archaeon]
MAATVDRNGDRSPLRTPSNEVPATKGYRGIGMEGSIARWYARTRGTESQIAAWRKQAAAVTEGLPDGAEILEVAPGPGYFAIEIARLGRFRVTGLDISRTFVEITTENARTVGVPLTVRQGDASRMPFHDGSFDLVVCQAAFKNFSRPQASVNEMYRVLRPNGLARIEDMRRDASNGAIRDEVRAMHLGAFRALMTRSALRSLRRRAYSVEEFREFARTSPFGDGEVVTAGVGLELTMRRREPLSFPGPL